MTDDAHHMSLLTLLIQGVAHRLAVDGQTLISRAIDFVPALQGLVQMRGGDADQHIAQDVLDRKSTRLNSSHSQISYAVFCLKKKKKKNQDRISINKINLS